ncbi:hypothetical protein ACVWZK_008427 [Bradyrhizobium sp. GM0.4]
MKRKVGMVSEELISCTVTGSLSNVDRSPFVSGRRSRLSDRGGSSGRGRGAHPPPKQGRHDATLYPEPMLPIRKSNAGPVINLTAANRVASCWMGPTLHNREMRWARTERLGERLGTMKFDRQSQNKAPTY